LPVLLAECPHVLKPGMAPIPSSPPQPWGSE
jgi:hypothetical protein